MTPPSRYLTHWHRVEISTPRGEQFIVWDLVSGPKRWCAENLSSKGELWQWDMPHWRFFYFREQQDAMLFRLMFG